MIFVITGIDVVHVRKAVSSLRRDSQRGMNISQSKKKPKLKFDMKERAMADDILASYTLPPIGIEFVL